MKANIHSLLEAAKQTIAVAQQLADPADGKLFRDLVDEIDALNSTYCDGSH